MAVSCLDEPDCFNLNNNIIGIAFKVLGSSKSDTLGLIGIDLSGSVTDFHATGVDSSIVTGVTLPLNIYQNQTVITFKGIGGNRTMSLSYRVQSQFVSEECGSKFVLSDLRIAGHDFDSARVINPTPSTNKNTQTIEIYRCPITNIVGLEVKQLLNKPKSSQNASLPVYSVVDEHSGIQFYLSDTLSTFYLLLDLTQASTTYNFTLADNITYTLKLNYTVTPEVRYNVCGQQSFVSKLEIDPSSTLLDSLSIVRDATSQRLQNTPQDPAGTNIYLFRCADTNLAQLAFLTVVSPTDTTKRADTVALKAVRSDYFADPINYNADLTIVSLPLNPAADATTFYLDYNDRPTDTVAVSYRRVFQTFFNACGEQTFFTDLIKDLNRSNIRLKTDSVQFPPVTNLEIIH